MAAEAFTLGGYHTDNPTGKTLVIIFCSGTLNNSGACGQVAGNNYAVTSGKTFKLCGVVHLTQASIGDIQVRYADATNMTTTPVSMCVDIGAYPASVPAYNLPVFGASAPAGKYVGIFAAGNTGATAVLLYGYEV